MLNWRHPASQPSYQVPILVLNIPQLSIQYALSFEMMQNRRVLSREIVLVVGAAKLTGR